jgi:hypothetical protein
MREKPVERPPTIDLFEEVYRNANELFERYLEEPAIKEALDLLDTIPTEATYHNKFHAFDVMQEVIFLARADGIPENVIRLYAITAAWHDVGYAVQGKNHEAIAIDLFRKSKSYAEFKDTERTLIEESILETELKFIDGVPSLKNQGAKHKYVADADVANFGRIDFFEISEKIALESGRNLDDLRFLQFALALLENHEWKTPAAQRYWERQKRYNMKILEMAIANHRDS